MYRMDTSPQPLAGMADYLAGLIAPVTIEEAAEALNLGIAQAHAALETALDTGLAARTKKGKYAPPGLLGMVAGRVMVSARGAAFLRPLEGGQDYRLDMPDMQALDQDLIIARVTDAQRLRAELSDVLTRAHPTLTAVIAIAPLGKRGEEKYGNKKPKHRGKRRGRADDQTDGADQARGAVSARGMTAAPSDRRLPQDIDILNPPPEVRDGDMALLSVIRWPSRKKRMQAKILRVMGPAHEVGVQLMALVADYALPTQFELDAQLMAQAMPDTVRPKDIKGRADLRSLNCFTIDGADAKDFDDAVSLSREGEVWRLGVHIADVSHYVTPGTAIDRDALERGTSVYLPGLTLPMLPESLSNMICSLMPDVDRLAMSLFMDIRDAQVEGFTLSPSVIHSRARLTYDQVNAALSGEASNVPEALLPTLRDMAHLAGELRAHRAARGSLDFDLPEPQITLNDEGEPIDVSRRERGESHRLIEEFMLIANETVAKWARESSLPFLYRVHDTPDGDKLLSLKHFLDGLGIRANIGDKPAPYVLARLLESLAGQPESAVVSSVMLRAMKRAGYSPKPEGHYGLAAKDYCHFTSPIRRYPDLVVHRMLKILASGGMEHKRHEPWEARMPELAKQTSDREAVAAAAEREADQLMCAHYMARHIGEAFEGVVSGVVGWGYYVTLHNTVEGLVHLSSLTEYFTLNETQYCLVGERTRRVIRLGDRVQIKVDRVDLGARQVHFTPLDV